jgi:RNA polymerase sigma-70 factor, ECF subfamily
MTAASDEDLVARVIAAQDTAAFEELVRRHQSKVRQWLRHLTNDHAKADDLAQETFLRAWQRIETFSGAGRFGSWLMTIAYNNFLQANRKQAQELRLATALTDNAVEPYRLPDPRIPDLPKMLAVLSPDERLTMILCYAHDLSHGEISEVIDMPLGTVKSHIGRAKAKIRARFKLGEPA